MIGRLEGEILSVEEEFILLDIQGVGFIIHVPTNLTLRAGERAVLYIHLHVRENELALYGFPETDQKLLFELLLGVNRVGPKVALSVMSTFTPDELREAILNRQPEVLSRASGVGKKTAEAMVLHLKDKVQRTGVSAPDMARDDADVIAALTALGFSVVESQRALQKLPHDEDLSLDEKIRRALTLLG